MTTKTKYKEYDLHIIEVDDEYLYNIFGIEDGEPMEISKKNIDYLEDYLYDYDEDDEEDEPKMNDEEVKALFDHLKELLKTYKKVRVELAG